MKTCSKCGAVNADDATFCHNCGNAFVQPAAYPGGPAPAPPPPASGQPPAAYPPQAPPPGVPYQPAPYAVMAPVSNSKATASLVLGIVGLFVCPIICSALALILGYSARNEIAASGGRMTGDTNATAGIILGWVGLALAIIGVIIGIIIAVSVNAVMVPVLPF